MTNAGASAWQIEDTLDELASLAWTTFIGSPLGASSRTRSVRRSCARPSPSVVRRAQPCSASPIPVSLESGHRRCSVCPFTSPVSPTSTKCSAKW